jgi:hypothetical protein
MPVNYAAAVKSARMQAVIAAIDADANPAILEIGTASFASILATITLNDPSFVESGGVITMLGAPKSVPASANGTAAVARIKTGDTGTVVVNNLSVGTAADISLNTTVIVSGQSVTINSGTISHAA